MIKDALFIAGKDIKFMLRAKETILWVFIMPIVFFFFIGNDHRRVSDDPAPRGRSSPSVPGRIPAFSMTSSPNGSTSASTR